MSNGQGIEGLLVNLIAAVTANTEQLIKINEGREAAMKKLEETGGDGKPAPRTRRTAKKDDAAEGNGEAPAITESPEADAGTASDAKPVAAPSTEELIETLKAWLGENPDVNSDARKAIGVFLSEMKNHFGLEKLPGDADETQRKQIAFFVARKRAGKPVDFTAAYDFDGDPAQDVAAPASGGGDFDGIG